MAIEVRTTLSNNGNGYSFTDKDGTEYQLVWRGLESPWLFAYRPADGEWSPATVADGIPRVGSANEAKRMAGHFANNTGPFDQKHRAIGNHPKCEYCGRPVPTGAWHCGDTVCAELARRA